MRSEGEYPMSEHTPTTDEMLDGYVTMRRREISGDRVLASVQALGEAERWLGAHDAAKRTEWEAEQGETEWAVRLRPDDETYVVARNEQDAWAEQAYVLDMFPDATVMRRMIPDPGPWEPVTNTEGESEFAPGECDGSGTCSAPVHIHGCYMPHRSDQCDSPDEYGHTDTTNETKETK